MSELMTLEEAAEYYGTTTDELLRSRGRGLEPGILGFKEFAGGSLVWHRPEVSPEREEEMAEMVQTIAQNNNICDICGKHFKSAGGLGSHKRTHEEEQ